MAVREAPNSKGSAEFDMVLTNLPFGKKSSIGRVALVSYRKLSS